MLIGSRHEPALRAFRRFVHLTILRHVETGEESVEGLLEHSKTKRKRYVNAVGTSLGPAAVRLSDHLREFWRSVGFDLSTRVEGQYQVVGPDYFVVRLSLMGLGDSDAAVAARLDRLERLLLRSASADARLWAAYSMRRAREREQAESSMDKRYVNLTGGARLSRDISTLCLELETAGFGHLVTVIPGPLMRSTHFRTPVRFTHMPLTVQSTYEVVHTLFDQAYERLLAQGGVVVPPSASITLPLTEALARMWCVAACGGVAKAQAAAAQAAEEEADPDPGESAASPSMIAAAITFLKP